MASSWHPAVQSSPGWGEDGLSSPVLNADVTKDFIALIFMAPSYLRHVTYHEYIVFYFNLQREVNFLSKKGVI